MSNISQFNKAWERAKERDVMSSPNHIFSVGDKIRLIKGCAFGDETGVIVDIKDVELGIKNALQYEIKLLNRDAHVYYKVKYLILLQAVDLDTSLADWIESAKG